ncbi:histidine phosphatase family protein [Pseudomonas plecoglossicida]|uniref:histidine phosphatase family protein n=1 Tax=Pseudomonas plecoglossicida TaxID=70775 RepID=UPI00051D4A77|nr:histidine phosphatase family protein [Pseudomonas plecoglossicida]KGK24500.1 phosphoglycerate mutase [Pseudomonas plecoglossicida]
MLTVHFVRHGESAANAGTATSDPALIPLTDMGWEQARAVAERFLQAPTLIVTSPYERAADTAKPTIVRFPGVPVEIWPVEEFTYLSLTRCANTTPADRRPWVEGYWRSADPEFVDGPGTESFASLIQRARESLRRLHGMPGTVAVFGHGQFIQAVRWLIVESPVRIDSAAMRDFRAFDLEHPISNCQMITIGHDGQRWEI